jgi:hypothetical protein
MPVKIKPPKQYYTVSQLAERWEWKVEDVEHLIETEVLKFAHKGALRSGHKYIGVVACQTEEEAVRCINEQNHPTLLYMPVINPLASVISNEEAVRVEINEMRKRGEFDRVILAAEVSRFEREHGEPTDDTAPPSLWPWGDYETPLLRILADAVDHFCVKNDLAKYPKKGTDKKDLGEVVNWIMARMQADGIKSSKSLADKMETLIAPRTYTHNRQRKQGKP